jgi:hypothetical protein
MPARLRRGRRVDHAEGETLSGLVSRRRRRMRGKKRTSIREMLGEGQDAPD